MMAASFRQAFSVLPHNRLASWPTFCVPQTDGCQLLWSPRPKIPRLGKMDIWLTFASWPQIWAGQRPCNGHRLGRDL